MSNNSNGNRDRVITVRVSENEYNILNEKVEKTIHKSMSEFMRRVALEYKIKVAGPSINVDTYEVLRSMYMDIRVLVNKSVNNEPYLDDGIDVMIDLMHTLQDVNDDLIQIINNDRQAG